MVNWDFVGALANIVTMLIAFSTASIVVRQVTEARRSTHASSFKVAYDILQDESVRRARRTVMAVLRAKEFETWTAEEIEAAELVCQSYDSIAIMCRQEYLPTSVIADSWGDSLRKTWKVLRPLVKKYRTDRNSPEYWNDYQWLARKAQLLRDSA